MFIVTGCISREQLAIGGFRVELHHLSRCPSEDRHQLSLARATLSGARCAGPAQSVCGTWATGGATNIAEAVAKTFLNPSAPYKSGPSKAAAPNSPYVD
jgi:hypothetical protein